jgi:hypothetical protein
MEVPQFVQLKNGDNRVVPLPVWMAKDVLEMLEWYLAGKPPSRTPCYAAEEHSIMKDLKKLIELVEKPLNNLVS